MQLHLCAGRAPSARADSDQPRPHRGAGFVRVPNKLLGALLQDDRAGAYAVHLLAVKASKGAGFSLNEHHVDREYGIGRRGFRAGISRLKGVNVLRRGQRRRRWATEQIVDADGGFVRLRHDLLKRRSALVAFILAVNLSPVPKRPAEVARRIGVKGPVAIRGLVKEAIETGEVAHAVGSRGAVWLARKGHSFDLVENVPAGNVLAEKVPAHRGKNTSTVDERRAQENEVSPTLRARGAARGSESRICDATQRKNLGPEWTVLAHWRTAPFFRERKPAFIGKPAPVMSLPEWLEWLSWYGGAPEHVASPAAHRQALEIAHELNALSGGTIDTRFAMIGLAFATCRAHAAGKPIRSLAFIVERLVRQLEAGDDTWAFDLPPRVSTFADAHAMAVEAIAKLERENIPTYHRYLLSTVEIERLSVTLRTHGKAALINGLELALAKGRRPAAGQTVWQWAWLANEVSAAASDGERRVAA